MLESVWIERNAKKKSFSGGLLPPRTGRGLKFCRYHSRASIAQVVAGRPFNRPACGGLKESD
jgi:hypothetical protein